MGEDVDAQAFSGADRQAYRAKLRGCLDVFGRMLGASRFELAGPMTGLEVELNLVDAVAAPAMRNAEVLDAVADPAFQTELGQWNLEINVPPRSLAGSEVDRLESELRASLNHAEEHASAVGAHIVMVGILPTLMPGHVTESSFSANPRYALLNEQILAARGEDIHLDIDGVEHLTMDVDSIAAEAACTSVQWHLQVSPHGYAAHWNAAQCIAGVQVALGANSPFLFGRELWRETRVALFAQSTDTRPAELKAQGVRPRVWFGERWITSIFDQFEENVSYFPAILPVCDDEDPAEVFDRGDTPALGELRRHNGTVYRWNRPVYDVVDGLPHLRIENRVLAAGPSVVDIVANGAFYYGLLRVLATADRPVWSQMSFGAAEDNFVQGAREGIHAQLYWPGMGNVPVTELVLRRLLPLAHEGLASWGVDAAVADRLLGIVEARCTTHVNGAEWQVAALRRIDDRRQPSDRRAALAEMLTLYAAHMHSNLPVHAWPLP